MIDIAIVISFIVGVVSALSGLLTHKIIKSSCFGFNVSIQEPENKKELDIIVSKP